MIAGETSDSSCLAECRRSGFTAGAARIKELCEEIAGITVDSRRTSLSSASMCQREPMEGEAEGCTYDAVPTYDDRAMAAGTNPPSPGTAGSLEESTHETLFAFVSLPSDDHLDHVNDSALAAPLPPPLSTSQQADANAPLASTGSPTEETPPAREFTLSCGVFHGKEVILQHQYSEIGRGSISIVYRGRLFVVPFDPTQPPGGDNFDIPVAIKSVTIGPKKTSAFPRLGTHFTIRATVVHPNIVHCLYVGELQALKLRADGRLPVFRGVFALEYSKHGALSDLVRRREKMSEHDIRHVLSDIVPALQYLHCEAGVVHNDVKPQNIIAFPQLEIPLYDSPTCSNSAETHPSKGATAYRYKLSDFSSSTYAAPPATLRALLRLPPEQLMKDPTWKRYLLGTAVFMSPESCIGVDSSTTSDIWSLGVTIFFMATGRVPWNQLESAHPDIVLNGYRKKYELGHLFSTHVAKDDAGETAHLNRDRTNTIGEAGDFYATFGPVLDELEESNGHSSSLCDLIRWCLDEDPFARPTCAQILSHPFMTEGAMVALNVT